MWKSNHPFRFVARVAALGLIGMSPAIPGVSFAVEATAAASGAAVSVTKAKKTCFDNSIEIAGVLVPKEEVLVRPPREGLQITKVLVEPGARVNANQTLAELTPLEGTPGPTDPVMVQAPVAGVIGRATATVGTMASARAEPLFQLIARGELEFSAQIATKSLTRVYSGLAAKTRVVGVGDLPGRVRLVSTTIDSLTQLGEIRISVQFDERLRPGILARAIVDAGQRCDRIAIPLSALLYGPEGPVVQVVRDNRVETRTVTTGLQSKGAAEIRQGIAEGDEVVARAGAFLRDGDRVRPILDPNGGVK
jgi:HlyD family secretion protein